MSNIASDITPAKTRLRLLSYNIQVAIASSRLRHYVTECWKHVLPHQQSFSNLDRISDLTNNYDIVALQEVDAGSIRSQFVNQVEYLARKGQFPFWHHQTNRNLGKIAKASNGLLSHLRPMEIKEYKLPGLIPGRGAMLVRFGQNNNALALLMVHLALSKRARIMQLRYISEIINEYPHAVLMGDLNCQPHSEEIDLLLSITKLSPPLMSEVTFPSWRPTRKLDYILITPSLEVNSAQVIKHAVSDHLPIAVEITLPHDLHIAG